MSTQKKTYTLCFDLDITFNSNEWKRRAVYANQIQLMLNQAIDGKVKVSFVEQQRGIAEVK